MEFTQSNDDCYFYYYSSCTKGDDCTYRHCEAALGTETVCTLWQQGQCFRGNCKFRHMENRINRASIPCYWENQPGGCRKPHCVFFHRKYKSGTIETPKIFPVGNGTSTPLNISADIAMTSTPLHSPCMRMLEQEDSIEIDSTTATTPVDPIVVSFDEESDTESVSTTPVKVIDKSVTTLKNRAFGLKGLDIGVKTLEQIKMDRIHKESEHFYKYNDNEHLSPAPQCYPPQSEFISLTDDLSIDKSLTPSCDFKPSLTQEESDLRDRLFKKRASLKKTSPQPSFPTSTEKKAISFKNTKCEETKANSFDFKIKTLAEIRREKELLKADTKTSTDSPSISTKDDESVESSSSTNKRTEQKSVSQNGNSKTDRKFKITRPDQTLYKVPSTKLESKTDTSPDKFVHGSISKAVTQTVPVKKPQPVVVNTSHQSPQYNDKNIEPQSFSAKRKETDALDKEIPTKVLKVDQDHVRISPTKNTGHDLAPESTTETPQNVESSVTPREVNKSVSVDELDEFLMDEDVSIDGPEVGDDILREIEDFLDS